MFETALYVLPHVNASLNALATLLLVIGFIFIKKGNESAHRFTMLSCFGVSVLFLICYLAYHAVKHQVTGDASKPFPREAYPTVWMFYLPLLIGHIFLAAAVPFLALTTIYHGLKGNRARHKKWAKLTFPIWLYVSVSGVLVYLMLYWWFTDAAS